ncbi:hypothetical protein [Vulcanisaeta distributa]|uniref:hypothetical protein n=1 Tax=Vulcanisaeta distributa TaxID=164451 RepID=UPI0006D28F73|nr:hypothetical protein [Vulcanisaeta distributa]
MRLYQLGILLIILAVLIPIMAVIAIIISTGIGGAYAPSSNIGGIVVIPFPLPTIIKFGNVQIPQPLIWFTYVIFLIFLALVVFSVVQYYRARRELMKRWQEEHK